jgi:microcystin-dependent protein
MKKILLFISGLLLLNGLSAQILSPQGYTYQAVARDNIGNTIINQSLPTKVTITSNTPGGTIQWQETHAVMSNGLGLFTFTVGQGTHIGGQPNFSDINWAIANMYMKVEVDFGSGYEDMGTTKLWSVPYSLYASRAAVADSVAGVNNVLPAGIIVMWSGNPASVPPGWALCNGTSGTPDLRGKFIVGFNPSIPDYDAIGDMGGSLTNTHTHGVAVDPPSQLFNTTNPVGVDGVGNLSASPGDAAEINHSHNVTVDISSFNATTGAPSDTENRPPFFVLAYIIKL